MGVFQSRVRDENLLLKPNAKLRDDAKRVIHKGLANNTGLYHCFLNVVIQSLWHLRAFRERFISLDYIHKHRRDPCIFCSLRTVFAHYEFSDARIIPPDALRQALSDLFSASPISKHSTISDAAIQHARNTSSSSPRITSSSSFSSSSSSSSTPTRTLGSRLSDVPNVGGSTGIDSGDDIEDGDFLLITIPESSSQARPQVNSDTSPDNNAPSSVSHVLHSQSSDQQQSTPPIHNTAAPSVSSVALPVAPLSHGDARTQNSTSSTSEPVVTSSSSSSSSSSPVIGRFQVGEMGDAEETLDEILKWCHCDQVSTSDSHHPHEDDHVDPYETSNLLDIPCNPPCISHVVFGSQILDMKICTCGATSDPDPSASFLYRVYVQELIATKAKNSSSSFGNLLKLIYSVDTFECPNKGSNDACKGRARVYRWSLSHPLVFAIMLAWPSESPERDTVQDILNIIELELDLSLFLRLPPNINSSHSSTPAPIPPKFMPGPSHTRSPTPNASSSSSSSTSAVHSLKGFIAFYGRHYVAFFYSEIYNCWLKLDDKNVSKAGTWKQVKERCIKGKLQPYCLFYESPHVMPLPSNSTTAKPPLTHPTPTAPTSADNVNDPPSRQTYWE